MRQWYTKRVVGPVLISPGYVRREVLFLFAGKEREGDVESWMAKLAPEEYTVHAVDIERDPIKHDCCMPVVRQELLEDCKRGRYSAAIMSPPCSSFSRARQQRDHRGR